MFTFATDYYLTVFVASLGAFQIAASLGGLNGLLFFKSAWVARSLGLVVAVVPFIWFFASGDRNISDHMGGLDANTQGLFFFFGAGSGLVTTLVISSLVNWRMDGGDQPPEVGLEALRDTNYLRALARSTAYWRKNWRTQTKKYFFGSTGWRAIFRR